MTRIAKEREIETMNIKINKLTLQNFKGIKSLEINADGENLNIYGDNATGKTTVFDAFTWLLFGKDSLGRSDFGIKTQDENGNVIHNLEHSAECELLIDENVLTLKKVYSEKWTKKRGSSESEFSGHETKYFVNEVPTTKKEYEQKIARIIDETLFKIITNPLYFNEHLKWQDRRAILMSLCGNITDDNILANNEQFSPLISELKGRTVQEYKKILQSKQTAINDELKAIPQRIAEANLAIPKTIAEIDEYEKTAIEKRIEELQSKIITIKNGAGVIEADRELQELKLKRVMLENEKCDVSALETELNSAKSKLQTTMFSMSDWERQIDNFKTYITQCEHNTVELREKWHEVNERQYTDNGICPTCGQPLPDEMIETAKAKFNTSKVATLEEITKQGKREKENAEKSQQLCFEVQEQVKIAENETDTIRKEIDSLTAEIEQTKADFEEKRKANINDVDNLIAEATKKGVESEESVKASVFTINEEINAERAKLAEIDRVIAEHNLAERQRARISELEADEKRLAGEYAELDKMAFLIDEFIKFKVKLLSEEINNHFKYAKFKLFEEQINGGIAECCELTYKGVDYSDLNNAARVNSGLDIINTLCELNDRYAPIIVDNSESVTTFIPTTSQMIRLVVSADDKALRVEKIIL